MSQVEMSKRQFWNARLTRQQVHCISIKIQEDPNSEKFCPLLWVCQSWDWWYAESWGSQGPEWGGLGRGGEQAQVEPEGGIWVHMGSHSHYKLHRVRKENKFDIYTGGTVHMVISQLWQAAELKLLIKLTLSFLQPSTICVKWNKLWNDFHKPHSFHIIACDDHG